MKLFITVSLAVVALMTQLSLADDNAVKAVQPPNNKLYPNFDAIATGMTEYKKSEISILGDIYTNLLSEFKKYLEAHNMQISQDYIAAIEKFRTTVNLFAQHPDNYNLQRAAYVDLKAVYTALPNEKGIQAFAKEAYKIKTYKDAYKRIMKRFTILIPDLIKDFITNLDESEQKQYADLSKCGQLFFRASDPHEPFRTFQEFITKIKSTENSISVKELNCKWEGKGFEQFMEHYRGYLFMDLDSLKF